MRWHGWLLRYAVGGSDNPADPALLLVHGFGASCDQWDQVFLEFSPLSSPLGAPRPASSAASAVVATIAAEIGAGEGVDGGQGGENVAPGHAQERVGNVGKARGVRLVALDLAGFGHSAKPPLSYSQYSWADCARDVALRVIRGPFFIAGNSIGG